MSVDAEIAALERQARTTGDPDDQERLRRAKERAGELMKVYIIQAFDWEYNDEFSYQPEACGGSPYEVYRNPDTARDECVRLNAHQGRLEELHDYQEGSYREDLWAEIPKDLLERLGLPEEFDRDYAIDLSSAQSDEDVYAFMKAIDVLFYEVVEMEVADV